MQVLIALGGMVLLLVGVSGALLAVLWAILVGMRYLPLVGRRHRRP